MPVLKIRNGIRKWVARVKFKKEVPKEKQFPDDTKKSYREAVLWEEMTRKELIAGNHQKMTGMESLTLGEWAEGYLDDAQTRFVDKVYKEKCSVIKRLFSEISPDASIEAMNRDFVKDFLQKQMKKRSGYASNKDRKHLSAAWNWGKEELMTRGFPQLLANPIQSIRKYKVDQQSRYVPPEDDFWNVFNQAKGQDQIMLLTFLLTAGRRGEIFKLTWADIDWSRSTIRLWTRKRREGLVFDYLPMTPELKWALEKWFVERPLKDKDYVFVCLEKRQFCVEVYGEPYKERRHFMEAICRRVGVKHFGFHSIRHLAAVSLYHQGQPISVIQRFLRHTNPNTTVRYLRSLGCEEIRDAINLGLPKIPGDKLVSVDFRKTGTDSPK